MLSSFETLAANVAVGRAGLLVLWRNLSLKCMNRTWVLLGESLMWHWVLRSRNVTQNCTSAVAQSCENGYQRTLLCLSCLSHAHHAGTSDHLIWSAAERWVIPREGSQGPGWVLTEILRVLRIKGTLPEPSFVLWADSSIQKRQKKLCSSLLINFILLLKSRKTNQPNKNPQIGF